MLERQKGGIELEREVILLVFLTIVLVLLICIFVRLIHRMIRDIETKRLRIAEKNTMQQLSEERVELVEKIEAESERR